ncbi:MAG: hypothetical protein UZ18_ATM001001010 [Armatimonadetes bacterium OLB18]|nr:MAG: hypothetical protein UZ18_ATM001001010 [Armatimonadetes bacterium OLB18]
MANSMRLGNGFSDLPSHTGSLGGTNQRVERVVIALNSVKRMKHRPSEIVIRPTWRCRNHLDPYASQSASPTRHFDQVGGILRAGELGLEVALDSGTERESQFLKSLSSEVLRGRLPERNTQQQNGSYSNAVVHRHYS